jgi:hypothetical protein
MVISLRLALRTGEWADGLLRGAMVGTLLFEALLAVFFFGALGMAAVTGLLEVVVITLCALVIVCWYLFALLVGATGRQLHTLTQGDGAHLSV